MFKGAFQNEFDSQKVVETEDLTRKEKLKVLTYLGLVSILQLIIGAIIIYFSYQTNTLFQNTSNQTMMASGIILILVGVAGLVVLKFQQELLQESQEQWFETSGFIMNKILFILANIGAIFSISNFFYQRYSYQLAHSKQENKYEIKHSQLFLFSFLAQYGDEKAGNKIIDYNFDFYFSQISSCLGVLLYSYSAYVSHAFQYRMSEEISSTYESKYGCKQYIRWVPFTQLKEAGCREKYTETSGLSAKSSLLKCPQEDQIFTSNTESNTLGMTGCLQFDCCGPTAFEIICSLLFIVVLISGTVILYRDNQAHSLKDQNTNSLEIQEITHQHKISKKEISKTRNLEQIKENKSFTFDNCERFSSIFNPRVNLFSQQSQGKDDQDQQFEIAFYVEGGLLKPILNQENNQKALQMLDSRAFSIIFDSQNQVDFAKNIEKDNLDKQFLFLKGSKADISKFMEQSLFVCLTQTFQIEITYWQIKLTEHDLKLLKINSLIELNEKNSLGQQKFVVNQNNNNNVSQQKQSNQNSKPIKNNSNTNKTPTQQNNQNKDTILSKIKSEIIEKEAAKTIEHFASVKLEIFDISSGEEIPENTEVEIQIFQNILECRPTHLETPYYSQTQNYNLPQKIKIFNLPLGYYTVFFKTSNHAFFCQILNLNQKDEVYQYTIPLNPINENRAILHWKNDKINLQLYLQSSQTCYASLINPKCDSLKFQKYEKYLTFQSVKISQFKNDTDYMLFVKEYVDEQTQAIQKDLLNKNLLSPNEPFLKSDSVVFYYQAQNLYPVRTFKIPSPQKQKYNEINYQFLNPTSASKGRVFNERGLAWLVFCLDNNKQSQISILQDFWISHSNKPFIIRKENQQYPDHQICQALKEWNIDQ